MGNLDNCPTVVFEWEHEGEKGELEVLPVVVDYLHSPPWNGNPYDCPSDLDYYGYTDLEWEIEKSIFHPDDEGKSAVEISVEKEDLSSKCLDKIEHSVLQFCSTVSQDEFYDECLVSMNYERNN